MQGVKALLFIIYFFKTNKMDTVVYYMYIRNGKEYFTPNEGIAFLRADADSEIKMITQTI